MLINYFLPARAAGLLLWVSAFLSPFPVTGMPGSHPAFITTPANMPGEVNSDISDVFTISCTVKAAPGRQSARTLLERGNDGKAPSYYALKLDETTGHLRL